MCTILLTGATGFLGSYLLKDFLKRGYEVIALVRYTSNLKRIEYYKNKCTFYEIDKIPLKEIFSKSNIDVVVHTACSYGRQNETNSSIVQTNLVFGLNLLENAVKHKVETFINTDTLLPWNVNPYSLSKAQFRDWLKIVEGIQVINLKMEHMYGPGDDKNKFIPWLINEMVSKDEEIGLTSGVQKRNFVFIQDILEAFNLVISERKGLLKQYSSFDVATNELVEVRDFVTLIAERIEERKNIRVLGRLNFGAKDYRENDIMEPEFDNQEILKLGWKPKIDYRKGINNIIDYYL